MSQLIVTGIAGRWAGKTMPLNPGQYTIGRDSAHPISDPTDALLSRSHLRLFYSGDEWHCADLGSSNGTFIDRQRITGSSKIRGQCELRFGAQVWRIRTATANPSISEVRFDRGDGKTACRRCGGRLGFLGAVAATARMGLCAECNRTVANAFDRFRAAFSALVRSKPLLGPSELLEVRNCASGLGLPLNEALSPLKADCLMILQRQFSIAKQDEVIEPHEEKFMLEVQKGLCLSDSDAAPVWEEVRFYKRLQEIRAGKLSPVKTGTVLPPDEICYLEESSIYHRELTSSVKLIHGRLVLTNKRVLFVSTEGGFEFALGKIAEVHVADGAGINILLTRKQGSGYYRIGQPGLVVAYFDFLLGHHHRLVNVGQTASRSIPQHVKAEVWARDGGRCIQCGEGQYLEYDHIIPFSLGGATSVENLQLLCRGCNLAKGARL